MVYEIFKQSNSKVPNIDYWHWRLVKLIGNVPIAQSVVGYETRQECESSIHLVMMSDYKTPIIVIKNKSSKSDLITTN